MEKNVTKVIEMTPTVNADGIDKIRQLLYDNTELVWIPVDVFGGLERVNKNGKMSKRLKRNLRRDYSVTLTDQIVQDIGNIMNTYSMSQDKYIVEFSDDFHETVGNFGDGGSCFQEGGCYHKCLLAMDDDQSSAVFRVYREDETRLARAWVFMADDGAIILFNAYGLTMHKIAILAGEAQGIEPRIVSLSSDVYLNNHDVYALGGKNRSYRFTLDVNAFSTHENCCECGDEVDEDNAMYSDHGDCYCERCFNENFYNCERCGEYHNIEDTVMTTVTISARWGGYQGDVCEYCLDRYYEKCDDCGEWLQEGSMNAINGGDYCVCQSCLENGEYATCSSCDEIYSADYINWNSEGAYGDHTPYCEVCFRDEFNTCEECGEICHNNDLEWHNDVEYCPDCLADVVETEELEAAEAEKEYEAECALVAVPA